MIWLALSDLRYLFRHTLMRDAAYDMQLQARLRELHALAGWAIELVYAADLGPHCADLAYHYRQAEDFEQAFLYARLAGDYAAARFANQQAISHFNQALQSAAHLDPADTTRQRQEIYLALGELLTTTGQYDQAQGHLNDALALAVAHGNQDRQAQACRWQARAHELRGEYEPALDWIQRGLDALDGRETAEAAELLLIAGLIHSRQGDYDDALRRCQNALHIAEQLREMGALARAYNLFGHITRLRGDHAIFKAVEYFQQSLDLYQQIGDIRGQALAYNQIANAFSDLGQWREAEHHYRQAREIFEQIGDVYNRAFVDNNLGEIARTQGRLDEALIFYQEALHALEQISGSLYVLGALHNNLGATYIRRGEIDAARSHLQTAQVYFERAQARDWLPELYCHLAEAALCAEELPEAETQGHKALRLAHELEMRGEEGVCLRVLGEIATAQGQFDAATEHLSQSLTVLEQLGDEYNAARSRLSLARLHTAQGHSAAALATLEQCVPVFERLEARLDLAAARELLPKHIGKLGA
jgi:tetratricopeptide (TPR) repeat protein